MIAEVLLSFKGYNRQQKADHIQLMKAEAWPPVPVKEIKWLSKVKVSI